MTRKLCLPSALALGTLVPVAVAIGDKMIRDPGGDGAWLAVVLILGPILSGLVSFLVLWPLSLLYKQNTIQRVFELTLCGSAIWTALASLLMYTGPYRLQITWLVVLKYLTLAGYGAVGTFAFYVTLFLCRKRLANSN